MATTATIRELRIRIGEDFNTSYTAANAGTWDPTDPDTYKVRVTAYDDGGLTVPGIEDKTLQTRKHAKNANFAGLSKGTVKFSTYMGVANDSSEEPFETILIGSILGNTSGPLADRAYPCASGSSDVQLKVTGADGYMEAGQAVLVGEKGDGRGNGEVKPVLSVTSTDINLGVACLGAPNEDDIVVISSTAYLDESKAQKYIDGLALGEATADQKQWLGGMGKFSIKGIKPGELPSFDFELKVADHQMVDSGDRDSMDHGEELSGSRPPFDKGIGMVQISDFETTDRQLFKAGDLAVDPGVDFEEIPDLGGVNGIGGYVRKSSIPKVTITTLFDEDMNGLLEDYDDQVAKQIVLQMGHEAQYCAAIEIPKAYLDEAPVSKAINNLSGVSIKLHGTDNYTAGSEILSSALKLHWF